MSDLIAYTIELIVGGNSVDNSDVLQTIGSANGSVSEGLVQGEIAAEIAASVENGFYLKMTSNTTDGNQVINYSNRFTLISMKGTTSQIYQDAANAANGVGDVPSAQYNVIEKVVTPTSAPLSSTSVSVTATLTQVPSPPNEEDGPGSTTLKVGLIVGGIFALIGAASIIFWMRLLWRRRRQRKLKEQEKQARRRTAALMEFKAELPGESDYGLRSHPSELGPDTERFEAGGRERAIEMQATTAVFELEGNHTPIQHEAGSGRRSKAYSYRQSLHEAGSGRRSKVYDPTLTLKF
ncbi:uncharacterized protein RCC_00682 [Ramularia collo-cygni]|uniref:Uncharacterized protein n=1 Tax=Ramularia collo-cygni TaxID=112498 RepID=A0A2D3V360_9PEZI|nr:uncharacterized protein RCC_00682 [Ramularia collo-cygni]CZT14713.1 uncharacterized protein RCC_00682 [Ramularia collo-cygni]